MNDGIINFLKPAGMTSHDAVGFLRRMTGIRKIGHTGTLDPMATGVLPLCIGKATRVISYMESDDKVYRCEMQLGIYTDTQDIWGTVTEGPYTGNKAKDVPPIPWPDGLTEEKIHKAFSSLQGKISQIPPAYSAVKLNGRKLYEYARAGETVTVAAREITINKITVDNIDIANSRILFEVECSKGTYVRSICDDVGRILGCGGTMSFLVRTRSGAFSLENTWTPEDIELYQKNELLAACMLPPDYPLGNFPSVLLGEKDASRFVHGLPFRIKQPEQDEGSSLTYIRTYRTLSNGQEQFMGIGTADQGIMKPDKVFINHTELI